MCQHLLMMTTGTKNKNKIDEKNEGELEST